MEARTAFDRLLVEGDPLPVVPTAVPTESDDARIVRQNREAVKSWAAAGVPVKVPV